MNRREALKALGKLMAGAAIGVVVATKVPLPKLDKEKPPEPEPAPIHDNPTLRVRYWEPSFYINWSSSSTSIDYSNFEVTNSPYYSGNQI